MKTERIDGCIIRETEKAIYANVEGCHSSVWIPRSQMAGFSVSVEDYKDGTPPARYFTATIPIWLWNKLPLNVDDGSPIPYATKSW